MSSEPAKQFAEGDHVAATCEDCGAQVRVPLEGPYSREAYEAAVDHCAEWIEAHVGAFHSEAGAKAEQ